MKVSPLAWGWNQHSGISAPREVFKGYKVENRGWSEPRWQSLQCLFVESGFWHNLGLFDGVFLLILKRATSTSASVSISISISLYLYIYVSIYLYISKAGNGGGFCC